MKTLEEKFEARYTDYPLNKWGLLPGIRQDGTGKKVPSNIEIKIGDENRWRRIYRTIERDSIAYFVIVKKEKIMVSCYDLDDATCNLAKWEKKSD